MDQMSHLGIFTIFIGIVFHRKCTACDLMFLATNKIIRYANLSDFHGYATYIPVVNVSDITVIEHDPTEGYVYWGDNDLAIISRARLNGTDEETLITNVHPASLAIDAESQMMYWIDNINNSILRSNTNGSNKETLIQYSLSGPNSIVLDTTNGKMYWTETTPRIQRANLNGTDIEELVNGSLGMPLVLTLNPSAGRMYWADGEKGHFMSSDMDGQNSKEMFVKEIDPIAMALYGDAIFLMDKKDDKYLIIHCNISETNGDVKTVFSLPSFSIYGMTSGTTNEGKDIVLLSTKRGLLELDVNVEKDLGRKLDIESVTFNTGVAFDSREDRVYFIKYSNGDIMSVFRNGSDLKVLVKGPHKADAERNLALSLDTSEIFWTNENMDCISRMTFSAENKTCLNVSTDQPTGIALDEENRALYWTESRNDGTIQRSSYTGDDQVTLVSNLKSPFGISIDIANNRMYWTQNDYTIGVALLNGTEVGTIQVPRDRNEVMTKIGPFIFWFSDDDDIVFRKNIDSDTEVSTVITSEENKFRDLKIVTHVQECTSVPCQNNGTCFDLINGYNCTCLTGFTGDQCQTDIDECTGVTCQNGGTCIDEVNGYHCVCITGFSGDECQSDIDDCSGISCQNNGSCVDEINAYHCSCPKRFTGKYCETGISYCSGVLCQNYGVCVQDIDGYHCLCMIGFIGDHCETGLGFVVLIIEGIVLMAFYICMCRGAMIQRKLDKTKGTDPASGKLFSLVHLPTTGSSTIYIHNKNILRMTEISEILHRFDN